MEYDDASPWPTEPDGEGPTLELIDPDLDNSLAQSWAASMGHGTPGDVNSVTSTEDIAVEARPPMRLGLHRPTPNPFRAHTTIGFTLDRARQVRLNVHDVTGRCIALLAEGEFPAGTHSVAWSGRNDAGLEVSAGVYMIRMDSEGFARSRKLLLLR